ncbi:MAG: hypothetical protein PHV37_08955 [Candidatus Gastranaerophilales bacterium]|nr:hypothetical protein [Candidatus Gastranaerophilales bacterium]
MKHYYIKIFFILYVLSFGTFVFAQDENNAAVTVQGALDEKFGFDKILYSEFNIPFNSGDKIPHVAINKDKSNPYRYKITYDSVKFKYKVNTPMSIKVIPTFDSLEHTTTHYTFDPGDLSITPSYDIINATPGGDNTSQIFNPIVYTKNGVNTGVYNGVMTITAVGI